MLARAAGVDDLSASTWPQIAMLASAVAGVSDPLAWLQSAIAGFGGGSGGATCVPGFITSRAAMIAAMMIAISEVRRITLTPQLAARIAPSSPHTQ